MFSLGAFVVVSLAGASSDAGSSPAAKASSLTRPAPTARITGGRHGGKLVPRTGALFGTTVDGAGGNGLTLGELERRIHRKFRIVQHYYEFSQDFPTGIEPNMLKHGRIPMIGWRGVPLNQILSGQYDGHIRQNAIGVRKLHKLVFLRWGYEMNGSWEPWGGAANGGASGPAKFVRAWRRIHDIFVRNHATNAVWVWAPNWEDIPKKSWNHWMRYYPGDRYVDWVGIDGFNWGAAKSWSHWVDMNRFVPGIYKDFHRRKPIMLAETASVEQGGNKAKWIRQTASIMKNKYPDIAAFVYFNGTDEHDSSIVWAVTSSSAAMSAFRDVGNSAYFRR
ncbi:MAG: glycoside hydrolase family 26 protein [Actinomycetota bacterium]